MKANWPTKKLGEVCEINPRFENDLNVGSEVGFLTMADVSEEAEIIRIQKRKLSEVRKGFTNFIDRDVLVAKITPCFENGKGAFVGGMQNGIGFGSTEFHVLRTNEDFLLSKYLYYIVSDKKFRKRHAKFMTGSAGQQRISTDFLKKLKIPLPPLKIQKQIIERMDKIAEAQKLNDKLIQKSDELFQSLLHQELDPTGKNWETKKLGEVAEVKGGKRIPKGMNFSSETTSHPYLRVVDFMDGSIRIESLKYISDGIFKFIKNYTISPRDIYISIAGTIGLIGKIPEILDGASLTENAAKILVDENIIDQDYLVFSLNTIQSKKQIEKFTQAVGVPKLALERIKKIQISIPPLKIQEQIVAKLSAAREYKKQLLGQKLKLKELFDSVLYKSMREKMN